ncbi:glycosyltransferase involved in cell wall biosynthesis [Flavobacterium sp. PL11]|jgi:glycosyltransferase involved in cell wall biosynthesis|uniref:glycosyltransferase n=1 Tax=Flavobacterium sp. PL11 TaxID=3071717 RepID=UPI002E03A38B|nr:glycosyltransferase involved in cell wall biosynthesis [Flavobacterium sp. PL11]
MRVVQIIDALEAGGAERMAVNYANELAKRIEFSGLIVTRSEGSLISEIDKQVCYFFLNKKRALDLNALFRLRKYVRNNKVSIVHAHGTSFFTAVSLKLICPRISIIWHDHYGARNYKSTHDNLSLFVCSYFFSLIFSVNHELEVWAKKTLQTKKVFFIPNFTVIKSDINKETLLKGDSDKRIVCLANLKKPKNHIALCTAFYELQLHKLGWSLHFIGKNYHDDYSGSIEAFIGNHNLESFIHLYDSRNDIQHILSQATIGILASTAEGFPVTLLEYGLAKVAVISTNVGHCSSVIQDNYNGLLFDPFNQENLQYQLNKMIVDPTLRVRLGKCLYESIVLNYSMEQIIQTVVEKYNLINRRK